MDQEWIDFYEGGRGMHVGSRIVYATDKSDRSGATVQSIKILTDALNFDLATQISSSATS